MSERAPWTADRELDAETAARAIGEAVPELAGVPVRALGSGWDFDAYEADGRWVFRFPRRAEEQARVRKDLALLPWIHAQIDAPFPRYAWPALRAASFPYAFGGYERLDGVQASLLDPASIDLGRLGARLGALFSRLHALAPPPALVEEAGLGVARASAPALRARMRKYLAEFQSRVSPSLARRAERFFDDPGVLPRPYEGPARLVHDDPHAEHVLLDAQDPTRVTGLLDWSDAALGDPARDFGCLYSWGGEALLEAMRAGYGDHDEGLPARARFLGLCLGFQDWSWWVRVQSPAADAALAVLAAGLPA
jgi:aminoglycoside phosphotransferase (APT) family kinase protein